MKKKITFKELAQEKLLRGINLLGDAVGSTMGAYGQTVLYQHGEGNGIPQSTKDGVTVAMHIQSDDPVEDLGINIVKDAARKTAKKAGDGTTTSTVLAQSILNISVGREGSQRDYIRGMEAATTKVMAYLDKTSEKVDENLLDYVANISTNSDKELSDVISSAYRSVGEHGHVWYQPNRSGIDTHVKIEAGATVPSGYLDPGFITNEEARLVVLEDAYVFLSTSKIDSPRQLEAILEKCVTEKKGLLVIADMEPQVATILLANKINNGYKFHVIKPPYFGIIMREHMEDLADLCGATLHGTHMGDAADTITTDMLGHIDYVQSDLANTVIRMLEPVDMSVRIAMLEAQIENEGNAERIRTLRQRLAVIAGGIAMVYVGAPSEGELVEKLDRVDDAVHAVLAAKQEGILPGGGVALKNAAETIKPQGDDDDYSQGFNDLLDAIYTPFNLILSNADLKPPNGLKIGWGVNVLTGKKVNMRDEGIIDPTMATKEALLNAVSVSKTILSTGLTINNIV